MRSLGEGRKNVSQIHFSRTPNYAAAPRRSRRGVCGGDALLLAPKIMTPPPAAKKKVSCHGRGGRENCVICRGRAGKNLEVKAEKVRLFEMKIVTE